MLPTRVERAFAESPAELVEVCRPRRWEDLIAPLGEGMRSIRDLLIHLIETEQGWIEKVARVRREPESFAARMDDLDAILAHWTPLRRSTVAYVQSLSAEDLVELRPFPWDASEMVSVAEIVWHVVAHEQYHRGQIFTRLALFGQRNLPDLDLIRR
jgi:uncharacterized damage-inducible protein DinB